MRVQQTVAAVRYLPSLRLSVIRKVFSLMGRKEKMIFLTLSVLASSSLLYSIGQIYAEYTVPTAAEGGTYREGIVGQPRLINPLLASSDTDRTILALVFSGLYRYDGSGNIIPDLAENMPAVSEDGKEYTVKMKDNGKWHNGLAVTADDVVFTIQTLQNASYNSPRRGEWLSTTVEKVDDRTVLFKLRDASAPFLHNLTLPLISKQIWERVEPADFLLSQGNIEAVGNGPYLIKEVRKLPTGSVQNITLESFANYHNGQAHIDTIRLNFYENSEAVLNAIHGKQIDGFGFSPFEQNIRLDKSNNELISKQLPLPQYQAVFFNTSKRPFNEVEVRRALLLGTDIRTIIDQIYNGQGRPINSPILREQVSGIPEAKILYNQDQARQMLDAAGWKTEGDNPIRKKNGNELAFTLSTNDFSLNAKTAELLAAQWQQIGVKVTLNISPTRELTENLIRPRSFDALLFAQKLGADPDPFIFWHSSQVRNPGLNLSGYANTTADSLMSEARTLTEKTARDQKYREFHDVISADSPAIFLVQNMYTYAIDEMVNGISLNNLLDQTLRFYDMPNWYIDTRRVLKR
jgi:peptide/nickel transport system substrate-binding protein